jgi:flagellin-like hook-associated protein FlgL
MSELKALAHDVTKNGGDVSNYETEYVQLQHQFTATTAEKFNGINLFSPTANPDPLFLKHPENGDEIQISRPTLGELNTGGALNIGEDNYSVVSGTFTWTAAKADAESKSGHLATITSPEEWQRVLKKAPLSDSRNLWIGATDRNIEGHWEWVTGEAWNYSNWGLGEPNDASFLGGEDYGHKVGGSNKWNDFPDNPQLYGFMVDGYIFEKPVVHLLDLPWSDLHASIMQVAQARAQNGAEQMRLEMAADLNSTNILNMESAVSRIMDVDIAEESATLARSRVLQQAGTAMLAQANQSSQSILKLIQMN